MADVCPECGAAGCREKFESMLALEFEDPEVFGAVHHVTVICYNLQHPGAFTDEALDWMRSTLRAIIEEGLSPEELRERSKKKFNGQVKVLRKAPMALRRIKWSMTALDIHTDISEINVKNVTACAKSIIEDMKARLSKRQGGLWHLHLGCPEGLAVRRVYDIFSIV